MSQLDPFVARRGRLCQSRRRSLRLNLEHLEERVVPDATVIEDFTSGLAPYTTVLRFTPNADVIPGAAHDGVSNALLKGDGYEWLVRNDSQVEVRQGDTISAWIDLAGNADGRAYFGFGARPNQVNNYLRTGGALTLVLAPNTNQLILENNSGFTHTNIAAAPMTFDADHWYRAEVVWGTDGSITGNLYDSDGTTLLASVSGASSVYADGGIAFRGFGSDKYFDTITVDTGGSAIRQGPAVDPGHRPAQLETQSGQQNRSNLLDPFEYQSVPGTGRDIWLAEFDQLQQFGIVNGVVGLAAQNRSENHGDPNSYWGQMGWGPVVQGLDDPHETPIETPLLQQYIFRQRPGEDTTIIGRSDVKHFFLATGMDGQQLRPGEQDTYGGSLNGIQVFYSPQQDVDPVTGAITNQALDYFGESLPDPRNVDGLNQEGSHQYSSRIDHLLQVNVADLDPAQNPPGTVWYLAGNIFTPGDEDVTHTSRWVQIEPVFDGSRFTFLYPNGSTGQYNVRTIPGLNFNNNLLVNGGFETGDFTGWTQSGDTSFSGVNNSTNIPVHGGTYAAYFGPLGLGYISQTVATIPGQTYRLSLWLDHPFTDTGNEFQVLIGGTMVDDQVDVGNIPYTHFTYTYTATDTTTTIQLGFMEPPSYFYLDDVSFQIDRPAPAVQSTTLAGELPPGLADGQVVFSDPIDPNTFTADQLVIVDPNGNQVNVTGITPADGTNTRFDVTFDPLSTLGNYTLDIGPNIMDATDTYTAQPFHGTFAVGSNLLVNGGFETGDFTGWTQSGNTQSTTVATDFPRTGTYAADLGPTGSLGFLSQTVSTTPGQTYTVDYWLDHPYSNSVPNEFRVSVGGTTIYDQTNLGNFTYTEFTFTYTATSATTTLQFGFREDPAYFYLDDVSFTSAPSPASSGGSAHRLPSDSVSANATTLVHSSAATASKWSALGVQGQQPPDQTGQQAAPALDPGDIRPSPQPTNSEPAIMGRATHADRVVHHVAPATVLLHEPILDELFQDGL
jgi:hypothetical protein